MDILVSGSLAYDRIMEFPGKFADHLVADKLDEINLSFTVAGLTENLGGTAGNIAYALSLLGEKPTILGTVGQDYHRYFEWLEQCGISATAIRVIPEVFTASAFITTDATNNQITAFNPGAMMFPSEGDFSGLDPAQSIAIIAPGNLQDMSDYAERYREMGIFSIFDPGQSLPAWNGPDLAQAIGRCNMLVSNDYELALIANSTGLTAHDLLEKVDTVVTTKGEQGCEIVTRAVSVTVPPVPTDNVVDPTGAGDAFRGGLIKGMISGDSMQRCVEMGTVCAHYAIQQLGTQHYTFTIDEFTGTLNRHFGA